MAAIASSRSAEGAIQQKDLAASLSLDSSSVVRILYRFQVLGSLNAPKMLRSGVEAIVKTRQRSDHVTQVEDVFIRVRGEAVAQLHDYDIATSE